TLDNLYNHTLEQMENGSAVFTSFYMTGSLRHYLLYIYLFFIAAIGGILLYTGAFDFSMAGDAAVSSYEWIITFVVLTAGVSILAAKSRLTAILLRSEEHTSELQSRFDLVCRLLLEKKHKM